MVLQMFKPSYISEQMINVELLPRQGQVEWQVWWIIFPIISKGAKEDVLSLSTPSHAWVEVQPGVTISHWPNETTKFRSEGWYVIQSQLLLLVLIR